MQFDELENTVKDAPAFQQALDANIIMSVTDASGIIIYANKKFCEVSKYTKEELVGHDHNIINAGFHSPAFFKELWVTILGGKMWHGEIKNKAKDGSFYWVDTVIVPVVDTNQSIRNFISVRTLITGKKEAELALTGAIFNLSHNIRQPLANTQALLTLCRRQPLNNDQAQMAGHMQAELDKIDLLTRKMIEDLHDYKMKLRAV